MIRRVRSILDFLRYELPQGIRNLSRWFRVIWHDRDWDYAFLLRIMEFKLRSMSKCIEHGMHVGCERDARDLMVCAELCRRIREDEYLENLAGRIDYRQWSTPTENPRLREVHIEASKDGHPVSDGQLRRWHQMAERNRKNDLAYLTETFRRRCLRWWS